MRATGVGFSRLNELSILLLMKRDNYRSDKLVGGNLTLARFFWGATYYRTHAVSANAMSRCFVRAGSGVKADLEQTAFSTNRHSPLRSRGTHWPWWHRPSVLGTYAKSLIMESSRLTGHQPPLVSG